MKDNWDELTRRLPASLSMLGSMVALCTSSFTSKEDIKRIEEFFSKKSTKGFEMGLAQSLESIQAKAAWLERDRADVSGWVKGHGYSDDPIKSQI